MKKIIKKVGLILGCLSFCAGSLWAASDSFIVKDIRVDGLQRISTGTVLNYLPVQAGEEIGSESTPEIIRALYNTGFFQSVILKRQGNTLIVQVVERATIGDITVVGNKEIPADKMKELLKDMGLVKGHVYQREALSRLEKELKQAYNARGKYNARVETKLTNLTENRVSIYVDISEGRVSRIKAIEIIGMHDFDQADLLPELALAPSSMFTYFSKKDQYSKAAMDASLESLRSYYLDRGYLKFSIVSSQVLLSPNKKDVFIYIRIEEGPQYHFSGYAVAGNPLLAKNKLDALITVKKGNVFSRKVLTESIAAIGQSLGDLGYGFPAINADPRIDEKTKMVFVTFVIDPGRHVYVRRINFHGNTKTGDYALRNVIRQDEGSLLSLHSIKESERQLRLLGYMKNVNVKTTPVPEANNQVDLDIDVEEAPSAEASASLGYGTNGPQFNLAFNQANFMGTGRSVGAAFNANYWGEDYSLNYYNPFYTNTGVGRGINAYYQTVSPKRLDVSNYSSNRAGADMYYSLIYGESTSFQFGYGYQALRIQSVGLIQQIQNFVTAYGRNFDEIRVNGSWNMNTYDQFPYPNRGFKHEASFLAALPATSASLEYYKLGYQARYYYPLGKGFIFTMLGNVDYGNQFDSQGLPFFENYYAGGIAQPGQVRGYESFSLGPLDNVGTAMGSNFLANANVGVVLPYPLSRESVRTAIFVDAGNVFSIGTPTALRGTPAGPMRFSAGISIEWRSPFGPLAFSVAQPLNKQPDDQTQPFQFTISSSF